MLSSGIVLLHDNARPRTAAARKWFLQSFQWEVFDHPPYSPDFATFDFHLFPRMKRGLRQNFGTDIEHQTSIESWLKAQARVLVSWYHYEKCLCWSSDYVEKQLVGVAKCCKYYISDSHSCLNDATNRTLKKNQPTQNLMACYILC